VLVKNNRNGVAGRTLLAGLCGAAAASGGGAFAALIYRVGYGLETGWTFSSPGGDMDFTGYGSTMIALPCGAIAFGIFGSVLLRRAQIPHGGGFVFLAAMVTLALNFGLILHLPNVVSFAVTGVLSAFFCFAAVNLILDEHTTARWRLAGGTGLLFAMSPFLADFL